MITFYANSVTEAYQKLQTREFKDEVRWYLLINRNSIDKNNVLSHFRLDAYDVYIQPKDLITQSSRLAIAFKTVILDEFEKVFNSLTSNISFESEKLNYSEINLKINTFKENLKILRKEHSLTQRELAKQLSLSKETIKNYEVGRREPTGKILCKLSIFFKVDPIDLIGTSINDEGKNVEVFDISEDNTFAENLKIIRTQLKTTQKEFSEKIGLKLVTLISYENNKRLPNYECLRKIATCLEVDPFVLVGRSNKEVDS